MRCIDFEITGLHGVSCNCDSRKYQNFVHITPPYPRVVARSSRVSLGLTVKEPSGFLSELSLLCRKTGWLPLKLTGTVNYTL